MPVVTPPYSLIDTIANLKAQKGQDLAAGIVGGVQGFSNAITGKAAQTSEAKKTSQAQQFQAGQAAQQQQFEASQGDKNRAADFFKSYIQHGYFGMDNSALPGLGGGNGQ